MATFDITHSSVYSSCKSDYSKLSLNNPSCVLLQTRLNYQIERSKRMKIKQPNYINLFMNYETTSK